MPGFDTSSGGNIDLQINKDPFTGYGLLFTIDQSTNMRNTHDEASVVLDSGEVRHLIRLLHDYIRFIEGKDYFKLIEDIESEKGLTNSNTNENEG